MFSLFHTVRIHKVYNYARKQVFIGHSSSRLNEIINTRYEKIWDILLCTPVKVNEGFEET
jgi:hypothetical protein